MTEIHARNAIGLATRDCGETDVSRVAQIAAKHWIIRIRHAAKAATASFPSKWTVQHAARQFSRPRR